MTTQGGTLVIGATGGIGSAVARSFAASSPLTLAGRNAEKLQALAAELEAGAHPLDVGFESHLRALFEGLGELETVIYAAGAALPHLLAEADAARVRSVWNANYFGVLWTLKYGLPRLAPGGRLYVIGARPELVTARGFSQYAASKAAVARALEVARLETRGKTLTLVLPPAVDTPLWTQVGRPPRGALAPGAVAAALLADRAGPGGDELRVG
ncbi:short-chain dehydrogenase [Deinococcus aetherius]|uniref:Short-chain dehydrogenase n=1 Tax=Deinococcus aetherius TaxID=200252 RepID=A0ABN6RG03_9DEIO|nr:SDR family NAD(P)-dependent oxidoreductase [Deinococcus aetherius]BDP42268.1 short-chain dehydrogenase [Deinococcus aetherius]